MAAIRLVSERVRVRISHVPRAILSTLMILMIVGLMGRAALISISSRVMPITDRSTMAKSNWFHLAQTHTHAHTLVWWRKVHRGIATHMHTKKKQKHTYVCHIQMFTCWWSPTLRAEPNYAKRYVVNHLSAHWSLLWSSHLYQRCYRASSPKAPNKSIMCG